MKTLLITIGFFIYCLPVVSQTYQHIETQVIEHYYYPNYRNLYQKAQRLLRKHDALTQQHHSKTEHIYVLAFRMNQAFRYMHLNAYVQNKQPQEVVRRIKAIEQACILYGLNINVNNINEAYLAIYRAKHPTKYHTPALPISSQNIAHR